MTSTQPPPTDGEAAGIGVAPPPNDVDHRERKQERTPNYLVRRSIAVGGVVAAIAGGAILVGSLIGGDEGGSTSGAADVDWNTIVLLDERSGQLIVGNERGDEAVRFPSGVTGPTDALAVGSTLLITSTDATAVVDLDDESSQIIEADFGSNGASMPVGTALTMLTATADGGRAVLAHGPTGDIIDTETFAPIVGARYDVTTSIASPTGREVLVTDSGNFQSVLLSFDREAPSYFPGRSLALNDDLVVTTQNVGSEANVTVFGHDGSSVTDARAPSVRAGMITGENVLLVTVDGEILDLTVSNGTTSAIDSLTVGTVESGYVTPAGDRLIVVGSTGSAIVDQDGVVLGTFPDARPLDAGIDELAPRTSNCLALTSASSSELVIASLDDGGVVAEAVIEPPMLPSVDGCTVVGSVEAGLQVVSADGVDERSIEGPLVGLSPDGEAAVTESTAGRLRLTDLTSPTLDVADSAPSDTAPPNSAPSDTALSDTTETSSIDLGPTSRFVLFTQR
jgi:hypothetical protein